MKNIKTLSILLLISGNLCASDEAAQFSHNNEIQEATPELYATQDTPVEDQPMSIAVGGCMMPPVENIQEAIPVNELSVESTDTPVVEETQTPTMPIMRCGTSSPICGKRVFPIGQCPTIEKHAKRERGHYKLHVACNKCCEEQNLTTEGSLVCDVCHEQLPVQQINNRSLKKYHSKFVHGELGREYGRQPLNVK